jgi:proline dehydrogenase
MLRGPPSPARETPVYNPALMSWIHSGVLAVLPHVPRRVMRRLSARYIAGESLDDELAKLAELARRGHPGILDLLGEGVEDEADARQAHATYAAAAEAVHARRLDVYVSVKPTHFGLMRSEPLALELYGSLARRLRELGLFLRVEMEDHPTTDATLRVFEALRREHGNVGIVLQSRLFRTGADIRRLAPGPLDVRMVKGIYLEPAAIAHVDPEPIRAAYLEHCAALFERGARVCFATHDGPLAERLLELVRSRGIPKERYEFQVLLGVQETLWERWRSGGHQVRVYVPYGPEWLPYSLRRLKKNPQILGHVMRAALGLA